MYKASVANSYTHTSCRGLGPTSKNNTKRHLRQTNFEDMKWNEKGLNSMRAFCDGAKDLSVLHQQKIP
jgi:hypothetical protein